MTMAATASTSAARPTSSSPSTSRKAAKASATASAPSSRPAGSSRSDPFYGHEETAVLAARFVSHCILRIASNADRADYLVVRVPQHPNANDAGLTNANARAFCRVRSASNPIAFDRDVCVVAAPSASQDAIPRRAWFIRPPAIHLCVHDLFKSHL